MLLTSPLPSPPRRRPPLPPPSLSSASTPLGSTFLFRRELPPRRKPPLKPRSSDPRPQLRLLPPYRGRKRPLQLQPPCRNRPLVPPRLALPPPLQPTPWDSTLPGLGRALRAPDSILGVENECEIFL
ncbi:UNVERIFIED_CONTAM: hypothetical protein PYX00_009530 [Menopon gallinae]|uniref:Uncharacterized protein n=1 Tax=Menopon gallinae TaxID=328185 RepID=A0AAW2HBJ3_9NEOP